MVRLVANSYNNTMNIARYTLSFLFAAVIGIYPALATPPVEPLVSQLSLRGQSAFTYWGFSVYKAALHLMEHDTEPQKSLGTNAVRLEITYDRDFTPQDFIESGEELMKNNPEVKFAKIAAQVAEMNRLYQAVKIGDTYTISYSPDSGLSLALNGQVLGTVQGPEFARAYLGIWLSKHSISKRFTEELLGGGAEVANEP